MELNEEQKAVVDNGGGELLVAAAAGSGKTSVLVERLLARVAPKEEGAVAADITDFVVITFTKEAAGELKQRIGQELNRRLALDYQNRHLRRQLTLIYQAKISTIHSFCGNLIREQGHLISVTPTFNQCSEGEATILKNEVVNRVIQRWYEESEEKKTPFLGLVNTLAVGNYDKALEGILLDIHSKVQSHADPEGWILSQKAQWEGIAELKIQESPWGQVLLAHFQKQVDYAICELSYVLELCSEDEVIQLNYGLGTEEVLDQFQSLSALVSGVLGGQGSWDSVVDEVSKLTFPPAGRKRSKEMDQDIKKEVQSRRTEAYDRVRKYHLGGGSDSEKSQLLDLSPHVLCLMDLVLDFSHSYRLEKESRNLLDYNDLEHFTVKLLVDAQGNPTPLAKNLEKQWLELMVDEYQDTNRVQNAIFNAVTKDGEKLFMVGDMKQAIYRFRLADPTIFTGKFQNFHPESVETPAKKGEPRTLTLSKNFRSRKEVLDSCNDFFADVMSYDFGEVNYKADGMLQAGGTFPQGNHYNTQLNIVDLAKYREEVSDKIDKYWAEARWVAKKIRTMVDEGFLVSSADRESLRPVGYGDFMLLLRSKNALRAHYILAMAEENIPLFLKEGQNIFQTVEVQVAISLLQVVDNPRQDVPLISLLRSPIFGFTADDLALLKQKSFGCFYDALETATLSAEEKGLTLSEEEKTVFSLVLEKRDSFLAQLARWRLERGEKTPQAFLWSLYEQCNFLSIYAAMDAGAQRKENLMEFYHVIGALSQGNSLFATLQQLEKLTELGKLPSTANQEREGEGVVLHSIHSAKGLEKPVVILAGLGKKINTSDLTKAVLFHPHLGMGSTDFVAEQQVRRSSLPRDAIKLKIWEETMSEELRLLYVAMTRAKEKLILMLTLKDGKKEVSKLVNSLSKPLNPTFLLERKSLGEVILSYFLTRIEEGIALARWAEPSSTGVVSLDAMFSPAHESQWDLIVEDYEEKMGTISVEEEEKIEDFGALEAQCRQWYDWVYPYQTEVATPSKLTASQSKGSKLLEEESLEEEFVTLPEKKLVPVRRPSFAVKKKGMSAAERGIAIHLMMEYLEISPTLDCSLAGIQGLKDQLLAERKLTEQQYEVMPAEKICAFLTSPWGEEARASSFCKQEFKFSLLLSGAEVGHETQEKMLLQGVVDCWYENAQGEIVIVDFKSDKVTPQDVADKTQEHGRQLDIYAKALEVITQKKVVQKVLWFFEIDQALVV